MPIFWRLDRFDGHALLCPSYELSKLRDAADGGARIGIILNGSPLFTGGAGSGESVCRMGKAIACPSSHNGSGFDGHALLCPSYIYD